MPASQPHFAHIWQLAQGKLQISVLDVLGPLLCSILPPLLHLCRNHMFAHAYMRDQANVRKFRVERNQERHIQKFDSIQLRQSLGLFQSLQVSLCLCRLSSLKLFETRDGFVLCSDPIPAFKQNVMLGRALWSSSYRRLAACLVQGFSWRICQ